MEGKKKNLAESGNEINTAELLKRLEHPSGRVDVVLDTDTFNEIDDQFALAYLICSKENWIFRLSMRLRSQMRKPKIRQKEWKKLPGNPAYSDINGER